MAIAVNSTRLGTLAANALAANAGVTLGATPTAGSTIIVSVAASGTITPRVIDARGNVYTLLHSSANPGFGARLYILVCKSQHDLQSGDVVSLLTTGGLNGAIAVDEVTGLGTQHVPDVLLAGSNSSSVGSFSIGATSATAYANELVWAVIVTNTIGSTTQTITPGTGYTQQGSRVTQGTLSLSLYTEYKIVAATGAQTADGTINTTNGPYVGVVLTFPDPQSPESARRAASGVGANASAVVGVNRGASFVGANVAAVRGANRGTSFVGIEVAGNVTPIVPSATRRRPNPIVA